MPTQNELLNYLTRVRDCIHIDRCLSQKLKTCRGGQANASGFAFAVAGVFAKFALPARPRYSLYGSHTRADGAAQEFYAVWTNDRRDLFWFDKTEYIWDLSGWSGQNAARICFACESEMAKNFSTSIQEPFNPWEYGYCYDFLKLHFAPRTIPRLFIARLTHNRHVDLFNMLQRSADMVSLNGSIAVIALPTTATAARITYGVVSRSGYKILE